MARLPTPRYRFIFALVVVICILLLWTREWSPEASPDDSYLSRFRQSIELPQGPQVYASEEHKNTVVTLDNVRYRWTTIHANVLPEKDARHLEILAFLEGKSREPGSSTPLDCGH